MSIQERKSKHREDLRQAILDAAEELFVKHGFENVSMRRIAEKIDYSPTTIYIYFKDKQEIFRCLMEDYFTRLYNIMTNIQEEYGDSPVECIERCMRAYVRFGLEHPNYYKMGFILTPQTEPSDDLGGLSAGVKVFNTWRDSVAACIKEGIFRAADVDVAAQVIWSINHGLTSLLVTNPNFPWAEREKLIEAHISCVIKGMSV